MAHRHHRHLPEPQPLPAPAAKAGLAHPPLAFPPGVEAWRHWGEPLACAVLTLVAFNRTLRRLNITVTDWGVAVRGMVWTILLFALLAYMAIGLGTGLAGSLAHSAPAPPPWPRGHP